ncbi:hypothetical protein C8E02_1328 [Vogesella indigofera]|uniref:Zinc ribbon domain-containing protein n=1 Tax=Vogesella indigofera TaxID=45465 RepID=A0A495BJP4_VOGIN|nr:hypothetical protein C8E02_1328 [Vogesella indigofera]
MEFFFFTLAGCVLAYLAAKSRGRSGWWWLLGWIGVIFVVVLPSLKRDVEAPHPDTHVRCPDCKELVRNDAVKCKHCGGALVPVADLPAAVRGLIGDDLANALKDAARQGDALRVSQLLKLRPTADHIQDAVRYADLYQHAEVLMLLRQYDGGTH